MDTKIESKIGKIANTPERIYNFLSDFRNFSRLMPPDKVKNWQAVEDSCRFTVDMLGDVGLRIIEKQAYSLVKITGAEESKFNFCFWIQLKEAAPYDTRIKLTIKVDLNPMMKMMAKKPLQNFVDTLVDQLEKIPF
jgi:carbon monoxide dehydrogenase subunit G